MIEYIKKDELKDLKVKAGTINSPLLNRENYIMNIQEYEINKFKVWLSMVQNGIKPISWHDPDFDGTKIDFKVIRDNIEAYVATEELKDALKEHRESIKKMVF